ncbi:MAG: VCBS repeat-containing protein [Pseudomonadota bacterium]
MRLSIAFFSTLIFAAASLIPANAADGWTITRIDASKWPASIVPEQGRPANNGLPDGRVATASGGDIVQAWYAEPTRRYGHAVLGDGIEAAALHITTADGALRTLRLPQSEVFEDRTPRLADLDGDGRIEVVTIRSSLSKGGSVTIYGLVDGQLRELATNGFIGRTNRWLNIAGIADFDGRPGMEIAFVRTPHIGGTLFFYGFGNGELRRLAAIEGFSNHAIGAREMRLSAITDIDADGKIELAVPSKDRATLRFVELQRGKAVDRGAVLLPARIDKAIASKGHGQSTDIVVGLENGEVYRLERQ